MLFCRFIVGQILFKSRFFERIVHDLGRRRVQIRFDRLEGVPAADLHDDAGVHLFIDEEPLREPAPEIVARHVEKVLVAGRIGCALRRAFDHRTDPALGEVDDRLVAADVLRPDVPMDIALDLSREVSVARLPAAPGRVLPLRDAESKVIAVGSPLHVFRRDLRDLEGAEPDARPELYHEVVAVTPGGATELLDLAVGEPALVLVRLSGCL